MPLSLFAMRDTNRSDFIILVISGITVVAHACLHGNYSQCVINNLIIFVILPAHINYR